MSCCFVGGSELSDSCAASFTFIRRTIVDLRLVGDDDYGRVITDTNLTSDVEYVTIRHQSDFQIQTNRVLNDTNVLDRCYGKQC